MKFTSLRRYIQKKNVSSSHTLSDCELLIDGDSFFRDTYKNSGCQFVLGPDCDRYADFIINTLSMFVDNGVKCYVIFSGATKHDTAKRKEIHHKIINDINGTLRMDMVGYFQPLLVNDVQKQVLEEMSIKYFVCEYDSIEAIVAVARKLKCPVLTNNVEYSCFGVSCITPNSLEHSKGETKIKCTIYEHDKVKTAIGVYSKMPILLALLNESGEYLEKLAGIIGDDETDMITPVVRWVKRQKEANAINTVSMAIDDENQYKVFKEVYEKIQSIYSYPLCTLAVKYFQRERGHGMFKDDKKWFAKGVSNSRIAVPYINLKKRGLICGSLIIKDSSHSDALLAAMDIIVYSHCLLKNSQDSTITFIGREGKKTSIKEIETHWEKPISNRDIFTKHRVGKKLQLLNKEPEAFEQFLEEVLPGYDYKKPLEDVPEESWILILTLVYYVYKKNKDFAKVAYCVLLSYVMLGPVSRLLDHLKNNVQLLTVSDTAKEASTFYNGLQFLFKEVNLKEKYDTTLVHYLSEFVHCLQHMNYLNKMCGVKIPCTVYRDTYNATFIYNTYLFMDNKNEFMEYLEHRFGGSVCLKTYKNVVTAFENCLSVVKVFGKNKVVAKCDSDNLKNNNVIDGHENGASTEGINSIDNEKLVQQATSEAK